MRENKTISSVCSLECRPWQLPGYVQCSRKAMDIKVRLTWVLGPCSATFFAHDFWQITFCTVFLNCEMGIVCNNSLSEIWGKIKCNPFWDVSNVMAAA